MLVEGPIDAVRVWQVFSGRGYGVVACMGSGLTSEHARTIRDIRPPKVFIFPDGDVAGKAMAQKATRLLSPLVLRLVETPKGQDPASLVVGDLERIVTDAKPVLGKIRWSPS